MKKQFTTPFAILSSQALFKLVLALFLITQITNKTSAQTANTFTATNAQISDTLTSGGIINAQSIKTNDTLHAMDDIMANQNLNVQGNLNLIGDITAPITSTATLGSLKAFGPVQFNNTFNVSSLIGTTSRALYVDAGGNILAKTGPIGEDPVTCYTTTAPWMIGGNYIGSVTNNDKTIGTCDNFDFALKANNGVKQWIKPNGTIGFGTGVNSNTGGPEYKFHNGAMRLSGGNTFGGPQIVFDGGISPYGDWGIEYTTALATPGLNFWKPYGSPNSTNNLFFVADNGEVGIGTDNLTARLTIDAWSDDGIHVETKTISKKAFSHANSATHSENFVIWGDGRFHATAGQLGFPLTPIVDLNTQLNIFSAGTNNGIKFSTNTNTTNKIIFTNNSQNQSMFTVYADGRTCIGQEFSKQPASSVYMLAVNGKIGAREIKVSIQNPWPDYVFENNYKLLSLDNVEQYLTKHKHLPNIPSAKELKTEECGLNLGEMQGMQMEKIEEIYLYLIDMNKELKALKKENEELKKQISTK